MRIVKGPGTLTWLFVAISAIHGAVGIAAPADPLTLAIAGRTNATPWIAAAGEFAAVAWAASVSGKGDIMIAVSRDGGQTFAPPVRVNTVEGDARISGEIAPRVALLPRPGADPIVTVTWNAKDTRTHIKSARSLDGGRTFDRAISLQTPAADGDRGWQAATMDANGALHAIWLDHRGMAAGADKGHEHKGEHDGVTMAQRSALYYASSAGRPERELFKGVCYCCKTALAIGPDGRLHAAWRHVFANNMRDIAYTVSRDRGATFAPLLRVHEDKWSINGCPDDGPAIAVDRSATVHLVWPTVLNGEEGALLYATSRGGQPFAAPVRVPTLGSPKPSHPQIAADANGRIMIVWDEVVGGVRTAAGREISMRNGKAQFGNVVKFADGASAYPVLASTPRGWLVVWSTGGLTSIIRAKILH
jgi:hypothetical protein